MNRCIRIYPTLNPDLDKPLAVIFSDGHVGGTDDACLVKQIVSTFEDGTARVEITLPSLSSELAWIRHATAVRDNPALIAEPVPDDVAAAILRHQILLQGPANRHDPGTPEWAWLVAAALRRNGLDAMPDGFDFPLGGTSVTL